MRILRKDMTGTDVEQWQRFLEGQGFQPGEAGGRFGDGTHQATVWFQKEHGLGADGIVGDRTISTARSLGFEATAEAEASAQAGTSSQVINDDVLKRIMPHLQPAKRAAYLPHLQAAMQEFNINNPLRGAAFLAQLAHESAEFRFMEEIASGAAYEGRKDLGNTQPGDGRRFKGRGPIQITGRHNYEKYGRMLGIDLINNPQLAATPEVGFRTAGLYWRENGLNELADQQSFRTITKRINGGFNGFEDRLRYYERAKEVLGVPRTRAIGPPDSGDDSALPRFTRGLDSAGEITPSAAERSAAEMEDDSSLSVSAPTGSKKSGAKKSAAGSTKKASSSARGASKKGSAKKAATTKKAAPAKKAATKSAPKGSVKSGAKKSAGGAKKAAARKGTKGAAKAGATKASAKKSGTKKVAKKAGKSR